MLTEVVSCLFCILQKSIQMYIIILYIVYIIMLNNINK